MELTTDNVDRQNRVGGLPVKQIQSVPVSWFQVLEDALPTLLILQKQKFASLSQVPSLIFFKVELEGHKNSLSNLKSRR